MKKIKNYEKSSVKNGRTSQRIRLQKIKFKNYGKFKKELYIMVN